MNTSTDHPRIALDRLHLSPLNARKTAHTNIEGLAASIAAHGLLQNLTVTVNEQPGYFEVVAGGRRLAALQQLQREGTLPAGLAAEGIPCLVISDSDVAHEASTAENTLREAMHPADQFDAFKRMVDNGKPVADVAAHFGVSELVVRQRLKLANIAPKLFQIYRDGGMSLEQLQALSLTDDQKLQERAWFSPKNDWERNADNLRRSLVHSDVRSDNQVARFVGVDAYEAAGGPVRRDLFSRISEVYLCDRALLDRLALDKLEAVAQEARDAGWSWAETHVALGYDKLSEYPRAPGEPTRRPPTDVDRERLAVVNARLAAIEALLDEDNPANEDSDLDGDAIEALEDEQNDLNTERLEIQEGRLAWPAEVMASTGVIVNLGYHGIEIEHARLKPGQKADKSGSITGEAKRDLAAAGKPEAKKAAVLSADMVQRLEMHRAAAIREHVAANPQLAIPLLLAKLLTGLGLSNGQVSGLDITPRNGHRDDLGLIQSKFADVGKAAARKALEARVASWKAGKIPSKGSELLPWIQNRTPEERVELLALATALTVGHVRGNEGSALAALFGVDMTKWWQPTPETFTSLVPKALLAQAVTDVDGKTSGEAIAGMKKDAAIADASRKLAGTGWLPKPLRHVDYKLAKQGKPKTPAPKSRPKKAAAKKAGTAKVAAKQTPKATA